MKNSDRKTPPSFGIADTVNYLKPKSSVLTNGMPVHLIDGTSQDILKIEIIFKSGSYHQNKPLVAFAVANLLKSGTKHKSAEEINYIWDFYGASLQIDAQKDIISVTVFCLSKYIYQVLELLIEMIAEATFPENELEIFLNNQLQRFIVNQKKVQHVARVKFAELLYGFQHPYGRNAVEADYQNVLREDLKSYFHNYIHPGNAICIISGKYPSDTIDVLEKVIQKFSWTERILPEVKNMENISGTTYKKHHLHREDAIQSSIRMGCISLSRKHPDYHKMAIANAFLGGYFGSRLMQNIRQDKGYTYGIHSGIVNLLHSSYFFISTQVGKDVCDLAVNEIYKELRDLSQVKATGEEIETLRNYLSASMLRTFDGPFQQSDRWKELLLFEMDYSYFDEQIHTLKTFTATDIQQMAELYFQENNMIELVVG